MKDKLSIDRPIWLMRLACYGYLCFAVIWWLACVPALDFPARLLLDISTWPIDGSHDQLSRDARFLSAIGAGLLSALALMILLVVIPELERRNFKPLKGTTIALLSWFVVDSAGCFSIGVYSNIVLNIVYVLTMLIPIWLLRKESLLD